LYKLSLKSTCIFEEIIVVDIYLCLKLMCIADSALGIGGGEEGGRGLGY